MRDGIADIDVGCGGVDFGPVVRGSRTASLGVVAVADDKDWIEGGRMDERGREDRFTSEPGTIVVEGGLGMERRAREADAEELADMAGKGIERARGEPDKGRCRLVRWDGGMLENSGVERVLICLRRVLEDADNRDCGRGFEAR